MMKNISLIALLLFALGGTKLSAQESILGQINKADIEQYIALAKQNYVKRKIQGVSTESMKNDVSMAKVSYLDIFNASYFYRPQGNTVIDPVNPYNINGFQFGVNINLGALLQKPFILKKAKANYKVAQLEALDFDTQLVVEVKKRYYNYLQEKARLKVLTQSASDSKGVAESLRRKFERSETSLEVFNQSRVTQSSAETLKVEAEGNFLKAKDLLEEIIGQEIPAGK
ncbi:TolC family protein [Pedobacter jeongneungensis]|uniref:TolC family protein n=1 Tax=Pedobacter jeongneungensis TaxID=947309 RepID=UPI0009FBAF54|nr:TolC family protein [Pedobacter jeongneungensis]